MYLKFRRFQPKCAYNLRAGGKNVCTFVAMSHEDEYKVILYTRGDDAAFRRRRILWEFIWARGAPFLRARGGWGTTARGPRGWPRRRGVAATPKACGGDVLTRWHLHRRRWWGRSEAEAMLIAPIQCQTSSSSEVFRYRRPRSAVDFHDVVVNILLDLVGNFPHRLSSADNGLDGDHPRGLHGESPWHAGMQEASRRKSKRRFQLV